MKTISFTPVPVWLDRLGALMRLPLSVCLFCMLSNYVDWCVVSGGVADLCVVVHIADLFLVFC